MKVSFREFLVITVLGWTASGTCSGRQAHKAAGDCRTTQEHVTERTGFMTTFEERTREAIRKMTENALAVVQEGGAFQQAQIEGYTKQLLASLSLDLPLSVKEVLDKGGAVRSFLIPDAAHQPAFRLERMRPGFETSSGLYENRIFDFYEMLPAPRFRVTLIIEPLNEEEGQ